MKTFISLALLVVASNAIDPEFAAQIKAKTMAQIESCAKEVSAGPADLAEIGARKVPSTREGKCILFCLHKIYSMQNEDGSLNMPGALANLEMIKDMDGDLYSKAYTTFKNCESTPTNPDPCLFAASLVECVMKEAAAFGIDGIFA